MSLAHAINAGFKIDTSSVFRASIVSLLNSLAKYLKDFYPQ